MAKLIYVPAWGPENRPDRVSRVSRALGVSKISIFLFVFGLCGPLSPGGSINRGSRFPIYAARNVLFNRIESGTQRNGTGWDGTERNRH